MSAVNQRTKKLSMTNFGPLQQGIKSILDNELSKTFTGYQAVLISAGELRLSIFGGRVSNDPGAELISETTEFDIASITKLFTIVPILRLIEAKQLDLNTPISAVLPEFSGTREIRPYPNPLVPGRFEEVFTGEGTVDIGKVTIQHLLTHTSGMAAHYPLYRELEREQDVPNKTLKLALEKPFCAPVGARIVYSDLGLIVLGAVLERVTGTSLAKHINALCNEIGIRADFNPPNPGSCPATEFRDDLGRRMQGVVHDENAYGMGGVAPHAGLFMSAISAARFGEALRTGRLLGPEMLLKATSAVVSEEAVSRGLGFARVTAGGPNGDFSADTYGHYGFTGTSLWIDPIKKLVAVLFTNRVFFGRDPAASRIGAIRRAFHAESVKSP